MTPVLRPAVERLLAKVSPEPTSGCWLWVGAVQQATGYGRFGIAGQEVDYAHRAAWRILVGPIPAGLYVCHRCDVRTCVNPAHLFLGTATDNMRDASRKGRVRLPPQNWASDGSHQVAVLTDDMVREIRTSGLAPAVLHRTGRYGVGVEAIRAAKNRRTFKGVA